MSDTTIAMPQTMLIDEFVNSVIIVDNKDDEMKDLVKVFVQRDIRVDSFLYGEEDLKSFRRNRQLIFIDLLLNENPGQAVENMSMLINTLHELCSDSFGLYGLIVWTKHPEMLEDLKKRISKAAFHDKSQSAIDEDQEETDLTIQPPLFILALNKNKYIKAGSYSSLPQDIEDALKQDTAAYFFFKWNAYVQASKDKAVKGIYQLMQDYQEQEKHLPYILYTLALNHTGTHNHHSNETIDAYKAFDELLQSELAMQQCSETVSLFSDENLKPLEDVEEMQKISAKLNERIFIDTSSISQDLIVPGNCYKIKNPASTLKVDVLKDYANQIDTINNIKTKISYFAIELTPPCDFSQEKKVSSRLVGGFAFEIPLGTKDNSTKPKFKIGKMEGRSYCLHPITIGNEKVLCLIIDFRYLITVKDTELKDKDEYEIWFRAKPKLFADILQKFSSHAARLGLSNVDLYLIKEMQDKKEKKQNK